ncbi:uncharacterized protein LOC109807062 [Cajanus cajan]|uniref:uncharacterized protein LOC109807062 n=1 Tax=Cajanus cajan TaxID=3821 RepID=UPI00098D777A|nr:uncharacterized protein LOC109807062 [Cajanus cajan]
MERFGKTTLAIRDLDPAVAMHHLTTALRPGPFGHTTEECTALRDRIEDLVKTGHLQRFVHVPNKERQAYQPNSKAQNQERQDRRPPAHWHRERIKSHERHDDRRDRNPPRRGINTIAGGFVGGGGTSSARKRHLRAIQSVNAVTTTHLVHIPPITFTNKDFKGIDPVQDDPMVISVEVDNYLVRKTLVDQGSSVNVLYWKTFKQLEIHQQELTSYHKPLVGFSGERVDIRGTIDLYTCFGTKREGRQIKIRYVVVHANTSYNILLERPFLNKQLAIVSTPHLAMKFPYEAGTIITLHADQKMARKCYIASLKVQSLPKYSHNVNVIGTSHKGRVNQDLELDPRSESDDRV